jgi:hypothetical protein
MDLHTLTKYGKIIILFMIMTTILPSLAMGATIKIYPSDDVYVAAGSWVNTNFQTYQTANSTLRMGYSGAYDKTRSLLKFDLSTLTGKNVTSAVLSLGTSIPPLGPPLETLNLQLYNLSNITWNERSVTWNTQPTSKSLISSKTVSIGMNRVTFTVTNHVANKTKASFIIQEATESSSKEAYFYSKDYRQAGVNFTDFWPYLEVTYTGGSCSTVADTDCNGCVSLTEYNTFKYNYKNGLLPGVTLTDYNTIKYNFKNGLMPVC